MTELRDLERQLRQAQKMEALGQLAGGIAHEFNNILQMIVGYIELMRMDTPPLDSRLKHLDKMEDATGRGAGLVRSLLSFSRKRELRLERVDVNKLITQRSQIFHTILGKAVQLELTLDPGLNPSRGDPGTIEQILINLLNNARDAMPQGGRIILSTSNIHRDAGFSPPHGSDRPGQYVKVSVEDSGVGMSEEVREQIFEPFFTTKGAAQATGLGLSILYGLVEVQKGAINISSSPGAGTTAEVYFPLDDTPLLEPEPGPAQAGSAPRVPGRVLIVNDESDLQGVTSEYLASKGYVPECVGNGEDAVRWGTTYQGRVDCIVMDVVMPKLGGVKAYRQITAEYPDIPIVLQTGFEMNPEDAGFLAWANVEVLRKPYSLRELLAVIQRVMHRH